MLQIKTGWYRYRKHSIQRDKETGRWKIYLNFNPNVILHRCDRLLDAKEWIDFQMKERECAK